LQSPQQQQQGVTLQQFIENQKTEFALMMAKYHTEITAPYISRILALEQQLKQLQAQKAAEEKVSKPTTTKKGKKDG